MDYFLLYFTLKVFICDIFEYLSLQDLFDIIYYEAILFLLGLLVRLTCTDLRKLIINSGINQGYHVEKGWLTLIFWI